MGRLWPVFPLVFLVPVGIHGPTTMPGPSLHRDVARLRPGLFLYAAPGLPEPRFAGTVVLLIAHGEDGSMGLVVNRPTSTPLSRALEGEVEAGRSELPLYWGGPVQPEAILALVRSPSASRGSKSVLADVHLTGNLEDVRKALRAGQARSTLRVYSGYAGWAPGQLAGEVRGGAWVLDPADAGSVFAPDPSTLWERVHEILDRLEVRRAPVPLFRSPRLVASKPSMTGEHLTPTS